MNKFVDSQMNKKQNKTRLINKKSSHNIVSLTLPQTTKKHILKGKTVTYEVGKTIYEKPSKKGKVCILINTNTQTEFIGKYIIHQKQHQVIFQCHFLNTLHSKSICNFIQLIRDSQGYWIIMEKAKSSLLDYLPKIKPQDVRIILQNIVKAYTIFYKLKISHRDIKLSNLVIDNEEKKIIKFIDLELCQKNDHVYGTGEFIPPEIRMIDWSVCDSYAFGKIAEKVCDYCKYEDQNIRQMIKGCLDNQRQTRWNWERIYEHLEINPNDLT